MKVKMTHRELVRRAASWLSNRQNCRFVLCETQAGTGESPDAIGWKYGNQSHLVEVKVTRADFFTDREKPFRKEPGRGVGVFRWFMVPDGLLKPEDLEPCSGWGLLAVRGRCVRVLRKATAQADWNEAAEICVLSQAVANAQLCAPMDLNEWFAHPETSVGRMRELRREQSQRKRDDDAKRTCARTTVLSGSRFKLCGQFVAAGYRCCSEHGGRTRGEKRKQADVVAAYEDAISKQGTEQRKAA